MASIEYMTRFSACDFADVLSRDQCMDFAIHALWQPAPRIIGPAFTVRCDAGDNLMVHAAIYRAPKGSIIVIDGGSSEYAVAGGNVCAVAARRGIAGFVIDGVVRDIGEVEELSFPVYGRGVIPKPGNKDKIGDLNRPIVCGGVTVNPGDAVVADREGIVVIPSSAVEQTFASVIEKADGETGHDIEEWERKHRARIDKRLVDLGFSE